MSEIECSHCDYSGNMLGLSVHIDKSHPDDNKKKTMRRMMITKAENAIESKFNSKPPKFSELENEIPFGKTPILNYFNGYNDFLDETKFDNRLISKEKLIEELERVSEEYCGGNAPKVKDVIEHSKYSGNAYTKGRFFDGFHEALEEIGFHPNNKVNITEEEYISEIKRIANKLNKTPTVYDMKEHGKYSSKVADQKFGSWNEIVEKAGLEPNPSFFQRGELNPMYGKHEENPMYGLRGKDHPAYTHGTENYKGNYLTQRKKALERANYECEHPDCNKSYYQDDVVLDCHHIIPNFLTEDEYYHDLDNLLVVCRHHHLSQEKGVEPAKRTKKPLEEIDF